MVRQVALISLLALVWLRPAHAAEGDKVIQRLAPPLGSDHLSLAEGLPNSNVRSIVQDSRGFVWFGTQDGLARYDGTKIKVYRAIEGDATSLSSSYIESLALDADGKLWIATAEHGVDRYDPETDHFTRYLKGKGGISADGASAVKRDAKNRMWFAMSGGGLNRFDPATSTFVEYATPPLDTTITAISADAAGNLWLATAYEGVVRWNPDSGKSDVFRPLPRDEQGVEGSALTSVLVASTGKVWVGSERQGVFVLDPATGKFEHYLHSQSDPASLSDDHIAVVFEDARHSIWVGTANGLNKLGPGAPLVQYQQDVNDPQSLPSPGVDSIYQDRGGVMWIGTFTGGVAKFDESRSQFGYQRTQTHATAFQEDADGTLWVGTYNDGLRKYEIAAQRVTVFHNLAAGAGTAGAPVAPISLDAGWITALHRDARGKLWIALKGQGLIAFDTRTETAKMYEPHPDQANSLPVDTVFDIWEDGLGKLWLATWGGGLVRFDPQSDVFTAFMAEGDEDAPVAGLTSNHLYKLYPDPTDKRTLWIGTTKGGLVKFDVVAETASAFRNRPADPTSLSSDDVTTIYRDATGILWVGTFGGGLNRLDPTTGKAEHFTTANSAITNDTVLGILPDSKGNLWMSTNGGGLLQFDPRTRKFVAYEKTDGLQDNEFGQGAFLRSSSGKLLFGGVSGFNAFRAEGITRDAYVPPVVMTAFKVFNQEVKLGRPIWTLPALEVSYSDSFEVEFAGMAFAAPKKNRYAYMLEGFDDKFIETDRPFATYTKLNGGKYRLRVRASNQNGVWNETGIALKISVTPPLWRTWPAFGFYVLLLGAAAYSLFRFQRQKLRQAQREGRLAVVERDLELTGLVQAGFLPEQDSLKTPHVELVGMYRPADACGGDWWWHETLSGGRHVILVGDVTGHGPGPAMVTAAVATAFRVLVDNGLDDVERGLELLNRQVLLVAKGKYHMTMAALELDEATGKWVLYSAGAPPILSLNQDGKHKVHFCAGAPLGTEVDFETGKTEGQLNPNDRLLLYTDGIPEILLANGNPMGMRRFALQFENTRGQGLRDAAGSILKHAEQSKGSSAQDDDWTFTMIEWA